MLQVDVDYLKGAKKKAKLQHVLDYAVFDAAGYIYGTASCISGIHSI